MQSEQGVYHSTANVCREKQGVSIMNPGLDKAV